MPAARVRDRIFAPWERAFDRLLTPFESFIEEQTSGSIVLLGLTLGALIVANSPFAESYRAFIDGRVGFYAWDWSIVKTVHHWVNDGLMALFFFVVGLEIKRELMTGELAVVKRAILPAAAALGGIVVPALLYVSLNPEGDYRHGWGIPMATDIAFAVGALILLGDRVPRPLLTFLVALAIIDDLCAVIIIALFYTQKLNVYYLAVAGIVLTLLVTANRGGVRHPIPYFLLGGALWVAMLKSGVHATLAGVLTALTIPSYAKYDRDLFAHRFKRLMGAYDKAYAAADSVHKSQKIRAVLQAMEDGLHGSRSPAYLLEHRLHLPVMFVIVPLFAFVNAGIVIDAEVLQTAATHPVTIGVAVSLVGGKFIGVFGATWVMARCGFGELPRGANFVHLAGAALLAGIGFTMSIFITELAFHGNDELIEYSKIGILAASGLASIAGLLVIRFGTQPVTGAAVAGTRV